MRVLYTNKLESASSLTATTENYNFPTQQYPCESTCNGI